jgi:hypothetical protein
MPQLVGMLKLLNNSALLQNVSNHLRKDAKQYDQVMTRKTQVLESPRSPLNPMDLNLL